MKTLEEIKDQIAEELGWKNYQNFIEGFDTGNITIRWLNEYLEEVIKTYSNQKIDQVAEKAKINIWRNYPNIHSLDVQSLTTHHDLGKDILSISKESILSFKDKI